MVEKTSTCDPHIERKTLQVYPHLPQAVCVAGGCGFLNQHLPLHWIGRTIAEDRALLRWLPKSPAPTPCDVFLWGYVKVSLYCLYHRICLSCGTKNHRCLLRNPIVTWCSGCGRKWIIDLSSVCHKGRKHRALKSYAKNLENF
jgi:hypothetical protein